ncbi:MAG: dTDP-4-dehydrorhamnose 3,5-epimerase, partial [Pseudomonadota bacterium]
MKSTNLRIPGLVLIDQVIHRDSRGFFSETFNARRFAEAGIACDFVQDNQSLSVDRGVIRGLHFQAQPHAQDKLVRVTRGSILDVAVDIRVGSPTYGQHEAVVLSVENWRQLWVPQGFAHGFCTLEPNTEVLYKVSDFYAPEAEFGLAWDDPALDIGWPVKGAEAVLSPKDQEHPRLADLPE